ncbi:unnamed protein product [Gordionus sp. m RMFG-2023]|uniref:uncharacterized protein LOC135922144 n=1 Tax=Gordionus sp. m RMFG-2023 TaxID=3053472 RepID=UPI0030E56593
METSFENVLDKIIAEDSNIEWLIITDSKGYCVGHRGKVNKEISGIVSEISNLSFSLFNQNKDDVEKLIDIGESDNELITINSKLGTIYLKSNGKYIFAMKMK